MAGVRDSGDQRVLALQTTAKDVQRRDGAQEAEDDFASAETGGGAAGPSELFNRENSDVAEGILSDWAVSIATTERETVGIGRKGEWKEAIEATANVVESKQKLAELTVPYFLFDPQTIQSLISISELSSDELSSSNSSLRRFNMSNCSSAGCFVSFDAFVCRGENAPFAFIAFSLASFSFTALFIDLPLPSLHFQHSLHSSN